MVSWIRQNKTVSVWIPPVFWAAVILVFSVVPYSQDIPIEIGPFDKVGHFFGYAILAILMIRGIYYNRSFSHVRSFLFTLILGGGYGILMELVQRFIPGREAALDDIVANFAGIIFGIILGGLYYGRNKII